MSSATATGTRAAQILVIGTVLWALSFPATIAIGECQKTLVPGNHPWFLSSILVIYRFSLAAILLALFTARTLPQLTRSELWQGLGLGFFGGMGILLQVDGMNSTSATTSAFLTQCYCMFIPIWVAIRTRRWPPAKVFCSCALVVAGVAILAKVDWQHFHLGRGELETIAASLFFTGQILWLERPKFAANRANHFSVIMFASMAVVCLPIAIAQAPSAAAWVNAYSTVPTLGLLAILTFPCTLCAYMLMNHWQRHVSATHAGLIYCLEPVFTSFYALFLPGLFSIWASINYANEELTNRLLVGGGLITAANALLYLPVRRDRSVAPAAAAAIPTPER